MIKKLTILFLLIACLSAEMKQTYGLESLIIGADAMGRGGAYLGNDDSNHYVFQNYSFLADKVSPRVSLTAFKLISEVNYLAMSYSQDKFSAGFLTIQESGGYMRDGRNNLVGGKIGFSDTTLFGAYGFDFEDFKLGVRGKYYNKSFTQLDESAWGISFDLTGAYEYNEYMSFGAELNNIFGTALHWTDGLNERFPLSFGLGGKFKVFGPDAFWEEWFDQRVDFYADMQVDERNSFWRTGAEYWPAEWVALRAGLSQVYDLQDNEPTRMLKFVAGAGFNWKGLYFDYAYNPGDDIAANLTHFFTVAYRFNPPVEETPPTPAPAEPVVIPPTVLRKRLFADTEHLPLEDQVTIEDIGFLGFMIGYGGGIFEPEEPLTRRELLLVATRLLEKEGRAPYDPVKNFPDIDQAYTEDMNKAISYGMLIGYPDGKARVHTPVRRDEAAGVFARYADISGQPLPEDVIPYTDVPGRHWAYKDINLTRYYHLTQGIGHDLYRPQEYMLRRDTAKIVSRISLVRQLRDELPPIEGLTYTGALDNVVYVSPNYNFTSTIRRKPWDAPVLPNRIIETSPVQEQEEVTVPQVEEQQEKLPTENIEATAEEPPTDTSVIEAEIDRLIEEEQRSEEELVRQMEEELMALPDRSEEEMLRELEEEVDAQIQTDLQRENSVY